MIYKTGLSKRSNSFYRCKTTSLLTRLTSSQRAYRVTGNFRVRVYGYYFGTREDREWPRFTGNRASLFFLASSIFPIPIIAGYLGSVEGEGTLAIGEAFSDTHRYRRPSTIPSMPRHASSPTVMRTVSPLFCAHYAKYSES